MADGEIRIRQEIQNNPKRPNYLETVWGADYVFVGTAD